MTKKSIIIFGKFSNIDKINKIREKYDLLYRFINPHITLLFPFERDIPTNVLKEHMHEVLKNIKPFNLKLKGITGTMDNYIFLNVKKGKDEIIEIHDKLYTGILEKYLYRGLTYIPHITIGHLNDNDRLKKVIDEVTSISDEFKMTVEEISTIEFVVKL